MSRKLFAGYAPKGLDEDPEGEQAQREAAERAEDDARGDRWAAFVGKLREAMERSRDGVGDRAFVRLLGTLWITACSSLDDEPDQAVINALGPVILAFVETDGWDGVLSAFSRVYREMHCGPAEYERRR